jgi:hypothetical protein
MNRNVMVSHQKACVNAIQIPAGATTVQQLNNMVGGNNTVVISNSGLNNKRPYFKVVLNSDEIKSLIDAKDQEIKIQEAAVKHVVENNQQMSNDAKKPRLSNDSSSSTDSPVVIVSEATTTTLNVNPTFTTNDDDDDYDDDDISEVEIQEDFNMENGQSMENEGAMAMGSIKPVVRKRAPIFPFEASDHYVPDNNSNNVINKHAINPPPSDAENRQGFCLRQFKGTLFLFLLVFEMRQ